MRILWVVCFTLFTSLCNAQELQVSALSCEYASYPLGIDVRAPVLGWKMFSGKKNKWQRAYEIIVSNDRKLIEKKQGNCWSTGKIASDQSIGIAYKGKALTSYTRYYWRVRVYDEKDKRSDWSDIAWFETAMLSATDWKASWITDGKVVPSKDEDFYKEDRMPILRKTAIVKKTLQSARLYIAGIGYYEAYINGKKMGDDVLSTGWTNFDKRILYRTYDVTNRIIAGNNVVGILLGNGWYNPLPLRFWGKYNLRNVLATGRPAAKAELRITYTDGSTEEIITDSSWQYKESGVLTNSVYLGETYDARKNPQGWLSHTDNTGGKSVTITHGPKGRLEADLQPAIKIQKTITPVNIYEVEQGVYIADMGQNFAGVAKIRVNAPAGTKISLRYGEDVYKNGSLNGMTAVAGQIKNNNGGPGAPPIAWQQDNYITKGNGIETWYPRFTYHVFRYVEIKGWPGKPSKEDITGLVMCADVPTAGVFESSNPLLNTIQQNVLRTFKSNLFSVQSDCAGREKLGYGGDLFCTLEGFAYNMNMHNFYRKVAQDFEDDQRPAGGMPETAPFVGLHDKGPGDKSGSLGWQLGYSYLIEKLYDFYGDKKIIEQYYPSLQRQLEFLVAHAKDNLYYEDLSDHESLEEKPEALTASLFYYHHILLMERFSQLLHKQAEAKKYARLKQDTKKAILQKFYKGNGVFDNNTQAAQVFPLWYHVLPQNEKPQVVLGLKEAFGRKNNHAHTGIFATKMMFDVLRQENENELAYNIANKKDFPGWGHMVQSGATTVWETWQYSDNTFSQNHPMFGSITEWFYRSLLGINGLSAAFKTFSIKPFPAKDLQYAKGYYHTPFGKIVSDWKKEKDRFYLTVEVPVNTSAEICVPYGKYIKIHTTKDAQYIRQEEGYRVYKVGSGTYKFISSL